MKKMMLNKFKKVLETEKETIIARFSMEKEQELDLSGDPVDEIQGKILALANNQLAARDKIKLQKIEVALERIKNGSFGECQNCSEDIGEKRLMVSPSYNLCISCAEAVDISFKKRIV